jgi:YidC/Oxa1 family membrane protein insertase
MDRKSIIILVVSFIVLMLWYPLVVNKLYPPKPLPQGMTNLPSAGTNQVSAPAVPAVPPVGPETGTGTSRPLPTVPSLSSFATQTNEPEQLLELTNANAHYTFTSRGGGLKEIELLGYPEATSRHAKRQQDLRHVAMLNAHSPAPSLAALSIDALQSDGNYTLTSLPNGVRAEKTLENGLTVTKDFVLSTNYLLHATVRLHNSASNPLVLPAQDWIVGTATPMSVEDNGQAVGVQWYNGKGAEDIGYSYFAPTKWGCVPRVPPTEYRGGASNVVWVAVHNQFFTLAAMPLPEQPARSVVIQKVNLPRYQGADSLTATNRPPPDGYIAAMVYPELTLAPGQTSERQFFLFAGPKEYQTLARIGNAFKNELDTVMGFGGFFGFFAKALLLGMNWLHNSLSLSYAWAIIVITFIIKLVFWPLTQASTRSMKRMQALQPQMKAIQEKYKDDPVKMNRKTMEFMKEHKVSPLGGCLPMLLQIPVFFGFYSMIQSAIELRGASFLWISDLSRPDTLFLIPGTSFPFNLLPLIMGATMLWQARLTPASPGMDPTQQKIMKYMPLMFMVFLYNFSAGLTLYWTVQNLLTIAQTKLTKTNQPAVPVKPSVLTPPSKKKK